MAKQELGCGQLYIKLKVTKANIATLFEGAKKAGIYTMNFNASKLTSGFYYCKLVALSNIKQFVRSIKYQSENKKLNKRSGKVSLFLFIESFQIIFVPE